MLFVLAWNTFHCFGYVLVTTLENSFRMWTHFLNEHKIQASPKVQQTWVPFQTDISMQFWRNAFVLNPMHASLNLIYWIWLSREAPINSILKCNFDLASQFNYYLLMIRICVTKTSWLLKGSINLQPYFDGKLGINLSHVLSPVGFCVEHE